MTFLVLANNMIVQSFETEEAAEKWVDENGESLAVPHMYIAMIVSKYARKTTYDKVSG